MSAFRKLLLLPVALFAAAASGQQPRPIPVEDFARFEQLTNVSLSPDGKHVVGLFAAPNQKWPVISIWKSDALDQPPTWIPSENMRPVSVRFVGNQRLIFITEQEINVGTTKTFTRKLYLTDLKGSFFEEPLRTRGATSDAVRRAENLGITVSVFSENLPGEGAVLIERANVDQGTQEIWRLDTNTGRAEKLAEGSEDREFMAAGVSPWTGELLLQQELKVDGDGTYWVRRYFRKTADSPWEALDELSYPVRKRRDISPVGFDRDRNRLIVISNRDSNFARVMSFDLTTKRFDPEPLFKNDRFDIAGVTFGRDPNTGEWLGPIGLTVAGPAAEQVFVDEFWASAHSALRKQFPGATVTLGSRRQKAQFAIATVESPSRPPEYYLTRLGNPMTLAKLGSQRPWIDASKLGQARWVTYKARDGLDIPAILTVPPGWKAGGPRIPAVILPHGGPWARDFMEWDSSGWPQFLASRGYAVLQPQYRGSEGLGLQLWLAGDENWGLKMQDDKDDGAQWLVDQGIADPTRLAMFGYSYGGFAAFAAAVRPNGPYVCALSGAGVSSLALIQNEWGANRFARQVQGWTVKGMSPIENVEKADIPILLYHGDRDRQADTEHSRIFYRAMKRAGKDVEYVEIRDMWHTLPWRPEWHRQTLGLIEDWLKGPKCFGGPGKRLPGSSSASAVTPAASAEPARPN